MNLYTYAEAAELLGLRGRQSVMKRITGLASRGQPLTVKAGELYEVGARRLLTEKGLARLREYEDRRGKYNRQQVNKRTAVHLIV